MATDRDAQSRQQHRPADAPNPTGLDHPGAAPTHFHPDPILTHSGASYTISLGDVLQSSDVALAVRDNVITVAVTAEDGSLQNYTITIHRASS